MSRSGGALCSGHSGRDIVSTWESFSGFFLSESHPVVAAESCPELEEVSDKGLSTVPANILYRL